MIKLILLLHVFIQWTCQLYPSHTSPRMTSVGFAFVKDARGNSVGVQATVSSLHFLHLPNRTNCRLQKLFRLVRNCYVWLCGQRTILRSFPSTPRGLWPDRRVGWLYFQPWEHWCGLPEFVWFICFSVQLRTSSTWKQRIKTYISSECSLWRV